MMSVEAMKSIDPRTVDRSTLMQRSSVRLDPSAPREERLRDFIRQIKNPYCYLDGKTVVKIGVCGGVSNNEQWIATQKVLDDEGANIYIELVEFDTYNLPNEALNSGDIDLNAFQHKAYLAKDCGANGYDLTVIGDTLIAPLCIYSEKYDSIDAIKEAAGAK